MSRIIGTDVNMEPWQKLANAIIEQAANDYKKTYKGYLKAKDELERLENEAEFDEDKYTKAEFKFKDFRRECKNIEKFFHSEYYSVLTSVDGKKIIRMLRERTTEKYQAEVEKKLKKAEKEAQTL